MAARDTHSGVNRRQALRSMAAGVGAAATALWVSDLALLAQQHGTHAHLLAVAPQGGTWAPAVLSTEQLRTVGTLVELIIPTTDTPGARAALVDRYVDGILSTASASTRNAFMTGLTWIDVRSRELYKVGFSDATVEQQTDLLTRLSAGTPTEDAAGVQFFSAIKSMTISGYYSSEIGLKQELGNDGVLFLPSYPGCTHPEHL